MRFLIRRSINGIFEHCVMISSQLPIDKRNLFISVGFNKTTRVPSKRGLTTQATLGHDYPPLELKAMIQQFFIVNKQKLTRM